MTGRPRTTRRPNSTAWVAVEEAKEARQATERRRDLPNETVRLSDGSARTRGQVHAGHDTRLAAAAQRETRGDFEHNVRHPSPAARLLVVVVLALIEVFLLIWPVTDANWADPKSVAYVGGLVVLFVFMNEQLPKITGLAIRESPGSGARRAGTDPRRPHRQPGRRSGRRPGDDRSRRRTVCPRGGA